MDVDEEETNNQDSNRLQFCGKSLGEERTSDIISALRKQGSLEVVEISSSLATEKCWNKFHEYVKEIKEKKYTIQNFEIIDTDMAPDTCQSFASILSACEVERIMLRRCSLTPAWTRAFVQNYLGKKNTLRSIELPDNENLKTELIGKELHQLLFGCDIRKLQIDIFTLNRKKESKTCSMKLTPLRLSVADWSFILHVICKCNVEQLEISDKNHLLEFFQAVDASSGDKEKIEIPHLVKSFQKPHKHIRDLLRLLQYVTVSIRITGCSHLFEFYIELKEMVEIHYPNHFVIVSEDSIVIKKSMKQKELARIYDGTSDSDSLVVQDFDAIDFSYCKINFSRLNENLKYLPNFKSIYLRGCRLDQKSVSQILRSIGESQRKLATLDISHNPNIGQEGAIAIAQLLHRTKIEHIIAIGCGLAKWHESVILSALLKYSIEDACKITYNSDFAKVWVGSEGGRVDFIQDGFSITFPPNAVDKPTSLSFRIKDAPSSFPEELIPITPVIECLPSGSQFGVPISIQLPTWIDTKGDVPLKIFKRESGSGEWVYQSNGSLGGPNMTQFNIDHFCEEVGAVATESTTLHEFSYRYLVFTKNYPPVLGNDQYLMCAFVPENALNVVNTIRIQRAKGYECFPMDSLVRLNANSKITMKSTQNDAGLLVELLEKECTGGDLITGKESKFLFLLSHGNSADQEIRYRLNHVMSCDDQIVFNERIWVKWGNRPGPDVAVVCNNFIQRSPTYHNSTIEGEVKTDNLFLAPQDVNIHHPASQDINQRTEIVGNPAPPMESQISNDSGTSSNRQSGAFSSGTNDIETEIFGGNIHVSTQINPPHVFARGDGRSVSRQEENT